MKTFLGPWPWIALLAGAVALASANRRGWLDRPAEPPPTVEPAVRHPTSFPTRTGARPDGADPRLAARDRRLRENAARAEADERAAAAVIERFERHRLEDPRARAAQNVHRVALCLVGAIVAGGWLVRTRGRAARPGLEQIPRPWTLEDVGRLLALAAFLFTLASVVPWAAPLPGVAWQAVLSAASGLVLAVTAMLLARAHGPGLAALGLPGATPSLRAPAPCALAYVVCWPLVEGATLLTEAFFAWRGEIMRGHAFFGLLLDPAAPPPARAILLGAAVLVLPVAEEVGFRGVLLPALRRHLRPASAVALSAALFALVHDPRHVLPLFLLGAGLALVYERTGALFAPIALHVLFNLGEVARAALLARGAGL